MKQIATKDRPRGAKLGLVLALTLIVGGCLIFDRVYSGRASTRPEHAPAGRTLVLVHGGQDRPAFRESRAPETGRRTGSSAHRRTGPVVDERRVRRPERPVARNHMVVKGDSLYRLAKVYYGAPTRWKDIAQANGIREPYVIREGDRLRIP